MVEQKTGLDLADLSPAESRIVNAIGRYVALQKLDGMDREHVSKSIERGSIGARLKRANGFRCQIRDALGLKPIGFIKLNGEPYVEAHHATPVSEVEIGSQSATDIKLLCADHHRQMHYRNVKIERTAATFILTLDETRVTSLFCRR